MIASRKTLADGTAVCIRPIAPQDKGLLAEGLSLLSPHSAYQRFLMPMHRFSSRELAYLTEVDGHSHMALVAVRTDGPARLLGVVRAVLCPEDETAAEVAIVVADNVHRLGLGRSLMRTLCDALRVRGVTRINATMLASNAAAMRIFHDVAGAVRQTQPSSFVIELAGDLQVAGPSRWPAET